MPVLVAVFILSALKTIGEKMVKNIREIDKRRIEFIVGYIIAKAIEPDIKKILKEAFKDIYKDGTKSK